MDIKRWTLRVSPGTTPDRTNMALERGMLLVPRSAWHRLSAFIKLLSISLPSVFEAPVVRVRAHEAFFP